MCSWHPTSHSVQLYRTVREAQVWSHGFNVKYQSAAHPLADRGSLNGGTLESLQSAVTRLFSLAAAWRDRDAIAAVYVLFNLSILMIKVLQVPAALLSTCSEIMHFF